MDVSEDSAGDLVSELAMKIAILPYRDEYWTDNTNELVDLIKKYKFNLIAEVGCWLGHTTQEIARAVSTDGSVLAVDPYAPFDDGISRSLIGLSSGEFESALQQFLSNMVHAGVAAKIRLCRMCSEEAVGLLRQQVDLVFIDGAHDLASVYSDIQQWYPHVKVGGIICGDDWFLPDVKTAVRQFSDERGLQVRVAPPKYQGDLSRLGKTTETTFWSILKPA